MKYCSGCGRCLTSDDGETIIGLSIKLSGLDKSPQLREQLGKYNTGAFEQEWNFCYECFLDSLHAVRR